MIVSNFIWWIHEIALQIKISDKKLLTQAQVKIVDCCALLLRAHEQSLRLKMYVGNRFNIYRFKPYVLKSSLKFKIPQTYYQQKLIRKYTACIDNKKTDAIQKTFERQKRHRNLLGAQHKLERRNSKT